MAQSIPMNFPLKLMDWVDESKLDCFALFKNPIVIYQLGEDTIYQLREDTEKKNWLS